MTAAPRRHALVVPVLVNFRGFAELMASVDLPVRLYVIPNWIRNRRVSVAAAWNQGISMAQSEGADVVHVVNDDVVLMRGCLAAMARALDLVPEVLLVSGTEVTTTLLNLTERATYSCFTVRSDFLSATGGGFDEEFSPAYFEDDDMRYRLSLLAKKKGVPWCDRRASSARYCHDRSATRRLDPSAVSDQDFSSNRDRYTLKWGGPPGQETLTTPFNG